MAGLVAERRLYSATRPRELGGRSRVGVDQGRQPNSAVLLELCALGDLGYWGFKTGGGLIAKIGLGIGAPLAAAVVWGNDMSLHWSPFTQPRRRRVLRGSQRALKDLGLVLRQPFFDREHNPFRQHELGRGRCQPRDQFCNPLRRKHSGRGCLLRIALLALLGREGTPAGGHRTRIEHDSPYSVAYFPPCIIVSVDSAKVGYFLHAYSERRSAEYR